MGSYYQQQRYWVPRQQTVRNSDGKKVVTTRFGPRDWTRTTTQPGGKKSVVRSTSNGPMSTVIGMAMVLVAPAAFLGVFSIPIYVGAAVLLALWLNPRTSRHKKAPATSTSEGEEQEKLTSETIRPPEVLPPWTETYQRTTEELRRQLEDVTSPESAQSFVDEAVKQIKVAEAAVPEFYPGEFYYRFQRAVRDELKAELASYEREMANIGSTRTAISADLGARLEAARDVDDQDTEHAIWREREQKQAEAHAAGDTLVRRASLWTLRMGAVDGLGVALGGSRNAAYQASQVDTAEDDSSPSSGSRSTSENTEQSGVLERPPHIVQLAEEVIAVNAATFEQAIRATFQAQSDEGRPYVEIVSGNLHRSVGGYPGRNHRMPICCSVMRQLMRQGDVVVESPPSGQGATLKIRYRLPR